MDTSENEFRVDLLKDESGVYGLGANDQGMLPIITRPDKIKDRKISWSDGVAYQMIPFGQRLCFRCTEESRLIDLLYRRMRSHRAQSDECFSQWNKENRNRNLRIHHALKRAAHRIVNRLINEALTVADPQALATVRRFPIRFRGELYPAFCLFGIRAMQLAETFPALALLLFTTGYFRRLPNGGSGEEETRLMREEACKMVLRGDQLKFIAETAGVPIALRAVKPRAAELALQNTELPKHLIQYLPPTT